MMTNIEAQKEAYFSLLQDT